MEENTNVTPLRRVPTLVLPQLKRSKTIRPFRPDTPIPPEFSVEAIDLTKEEDDVPVNTVSISKCWCFTWPLEQVATAMVGECAEQLQINICTRRCLSIYEENCEYLCFGIESGGTTGYRHAQGFLVLKKKSKFSAVKKIFPEQVHLEPMGPFSSVEKNIAYCSKDSVFTFYGTPPTSENAGRTGGAMERLRWSTANDLAASGAFDEIDPQIKICHFGNLLKIHSYSTRDTSMLAKACGHWNWGVPGSGKSYHSRLGYNEGSLYLKGANKWWDGYNDQEFVLLEDLDPSHAWMANYLKCWMDIYPFAAEIKGGCMQIRPKGIIITSNYSIDQIFGSSVVDCVAIKRRCKVTHFPFRYGTTVTETDDVVLETSGTLTTFNTVPESVGPTLSLNDQ